MEIEKRPKFTQLVNCEEEIQIQICLLQNVLHFPSAIWLSFKWNKSVIWIVFQSLTFIISKCDHNHLPKV